MEIGASRLRIRGLINVHDNRTFHFIAFEITLEYITQVRQAAENATVTQHMSTIDKSAQCLRSRELRSHFQQENNRTALPCLPGCLPTIPYLVPTEAVEPQAWAIAVCAWSSAPYLGGPRTCTTSAASS